MFKTNRSPFRDLLGKHLFGLDRAVDSRDDLDGKEGKKGIEEDEIKYPNWIGYSRSSDQLSCYVGTQVHGIG